MSRIASTFDALQNDGRRALIPYVTAGFPFADITPQLMHGMVEAGADVIELGVPFSDPMADGPVIQQAGEKALALGIGMKQVLAMVAAFRVANQKTPVVLMGYANPVERYDGIHGKHAFVRDAAAGAGQDESRRQQLTAAAAQLAKTARELGFSDEAALAAARGALARTAAGSAG